MFSSNTMTPLNGTYTVRELSPPQGYHGTDEVKTVVINSDSGVLEFTFKNSPTSGILIRAHRQSLYRASK